VARSRPNVGALRIELVTGSLRALTFTALIDLGNPLSSPQPFGAANAVAAGLGGIYYLPLLVLWPLISCLYTYFFRKTGRIYVGVFLVTAYIVWTLAASGDFGLWPIIG